MAVRKADLASDRATLWLAVQPSVRRAAKHFTGQRDVEDIVQDVAEKFLRFAGEFRSEAHARSWAKVVAEHRIISLSRRTECVPVADLDRPGAAEATEERALCRLALDCARTYMRRHGINESWLLGSPLGEPVSAAERAEKSRLRRRLQAHVREKIGLPALLPPWRWLTPAAVALAVVPIPFLAGLQLPETASSRPETPAAIDRLAEPVPSEPVVSQQTAPSVPPSRQASPGDVPGPGDSVRMVASVPTPWGDAQWREVEPSPDGPPPPVFCAQNLRIAPDVCVDHPLK